MEKSLACPYFIKSTAVYIKWSEKFCLRSHVFFSECIIQISYCLLTTGRFVFCCLSFNFTCIKLCPPFSLIAASGFPETNIGTKMSWRQQQRFEMKSFCLCFIQWKATVLTLLKQQLRSDIAHACEKKEWGIIKSRLHLPIIIVLPTISIYTEDERRKHIVTRKVWYSFHEVKNIKNFHDIYSQRSWPLGDYYELLFQGLRRCSHFVMT